MDSVVDCPQTATDEGTQQVLTRVNYLYRDAANYKQFGSVLLDGTLSEEDREIVGACLDSDGTFIPEQIGWPHPGKQMTSWPDEDDHCWAELDVEDSGTFEVIDLPAARTGETVLSTVDVWVNQMIETKSIGWDDARYGVTV